MRRRLAVHDALRAVGELDRQDTLGEVAVDLVGVLALEPLEHLLQERIRLRREPDVVVHRGLISARPPPSQAVGRKIAVRWNPHPGGIHPTSRLSRVLSLSSISLPISLPSSRRRRARSRRRRACPRGVGGRKTGWKPEPTSNPKSVPAAWPPRPCFGRRPAGTSRPMQPQ